MKIKKSSISKTLEILCTLIACVMSPCFNYRLTTPPHTADKPPDLIWWNLIPFFKKSLSELLYQHAGCTGRDETAVCNISQACSIGFRSGDLAGHSIRTIVACSSYLSVMRALCARAFSSIKMKFSPTAPAYGRT